MNIVIYSTSPLVAMKGGIQKISNNLAHELMKKGHNVYFLIKENRSETENFNETCEMIILNVENYDEAFEKVNCFLDEKEIDVIIHQDYCDSDFPKFIKANFDIPLISVIHNTPYRTIIDKMAAYNSMNPKRIRELLKFTIKCCIQPYRTYKERKKAKAHYQYLYDNSDRIVLLSKRFYPKWEDLVSCCPEKVTAIPNFNVNKKLPSREVDLNKKEKSILFVGRIEFNAKRLDRLILVWEKIHKKYPDWKLSIAGDGREKENIEKYITKKNIKNVNFLGFVKPEEVYKKASVFCMTSTFEGFPMVLIESSQHGCVPIAFDSFDSIHDIIENKKNGVLVQPFDLKAYQKELEKLMKDDNYRQKLQKEAIKTNDKFVPDQIADQWINLMQEVMEEHHVTN